MIVDGPPTLDQYRHLATAGVFDSVLFPRDAMHKRRLCRYPVSVRPSACPSRSWILSKQINISLNFFHRRVATRF